jgi:hypothetical protein
LGRFFCLQTRRAFENWCGSSIGLSVPLSTIGSIWIFSKFAAEGPGVRELVDLAKVDWRDLIVAAEYEVRDGKVVQNERGKIRLAELHVEKMRRAADGE